jgi:alpha-beta hydrolase superfamily lysophospholipase
MKEIVLAANRMFRYQGEDGTPLAGFCWRGSSQPKAIVQLAHGAGEHSMRYLEPLQPLLQAGYLIYAADHRGHGMTSGMTGLGQFGPGGVDAAINDMAVLSRLARAENPGMPLILFGHSMGAMFSQAYLYDHSALIDALILSGTSGPGPRASGSFNDGFPNPRTDYDWLSRDNAEVDKYVADPFCGIQFDPASQASLGQLRESSKRLQAPSRVGHNLPVYIFVGDKDPIHYNLTRLTPLVEAYRQGGLKVDLKVYPGGRHEMLNETNRKEVVTDLIGWLDRTVSGLTPAR